MINLDFSWKDAPTSRIVHLCQVSLQFILAVIVIGLSAPGPHIAVSVVALVIATLSAVTAILFAFDIFFHFPSRLWLLWVLFWQWVLTLGWVSVMSSFAQSTFRNGSARVKVAFGFDAANLLIWLFGSIFGTITMCFRRKLGGRKPDNGTESLELN